MPAVFKVANFDKTQSYDFTNAASKVRLVSASLTDSTSENGEPVELRFKTITKGTEVEIREALSDVERIFARATRFHLDLTEENSIWLYAQSRGSEKERRSLVIAWQRTDTAQLQSDPLLDRTQIVISDWSITRNGYWEAILTNIINFPDTWWIYQNCHAAYAGIGGPPGVSRGFDDTRNGMFIHGTAPGRIRRLYITFANDPASGKKWEKFWFGLKTLNEDPDGLIAHSSFGNTAGTPYSYDAWASGNGSTANSLHTYCGWISWGGGDDFTNKLSVKLPSYNAPWESMRGQYLVLFRMKATNSSSSFRTAMFQSWTKLDQQGALADTFQDVFVESDEWHFYEMGTIQVPPESYRSARRISYEGFTEMQIGIAAERLSGTGDLMIDYMSWIPQEYAISISNFKAGQVSPANVITDEDGRTIGYTAKTDTPFERFIHELSASNWEWPADPDKYSIIVTAADMAIGDGNHPLDKQPILQFWVVPRYYSYNAD